VTDLKAYPWSSYAVYACGARNPLVDEDPYYAQLGLSAAERQAAYRDFVRVDSPYATILDQELVESAF